MIELYTDASYCDQRMIAGWGSCLVESGKIVSMCSGVTKNITHINNAEGHAIKMGLFSFMLEYHPKNTVIIWCDNIAVCNMIMRSGRSYGNFDLVRDSIYTILHDNLTPYYINYIPRRSNKFAKKVDTLARQEFKNYG